MSIYEESYDTPECLLLGVDAAGSRVDGHDFYTIDKKTDRGHLISCYNSLEPSLRERVLGYAEAFSTIKVKGDNKKTN